MSPQYNHYVCMPMYSTLQMKRKKTNTRERPTFLMRVPLQARNIKSQEMTKKKWRRREGGKVGRWDPTHDMDDNEWLAKYSHFILTMLAGIDYGIKIVGPWANFVGN